MTTAEKIALVKTIINSPRATDAEVEAYLLFAKEAMMARLYPFGRGTQTDIPAEYEVLQCRLAANQYLKRGTEGEIVHIENGVHRHYHSTNDEELLSQLTPRAGIPGVVR